MNSSQILLANFDSLVQKSLYEMLCRSGHKVGVANSREEAISLLDKKPYRVVLTDINGSDDIDLLKIIKERNVSSEIIVVASYGNIETAINSIKLGAFDYLVRPVKDEKILSAIDRALANNTPLKKPHSFLKQLSNKDDSYYGLIGTSPKLIEIFALIDRIANTSATVLLQGESGTGKRMIAHAIHKADKKRRHKSFIEVSCGALPRDLIESELYGHVKGAFTGALNDRKGRFDLANGGTILLDDIDSLPLDLQVKLLRVLQEREFERVGDQKTLKVDVRVIATTNQDIKKFVAEKKFREDLYYRINVISVNVPTLREVKEDLSLLTHHFISLYSKENHKKITGVAQETLQALINYNWPGNIRELENIIERAVILDTDSVIKTDDLPEIIRSENTFVPVEAGQNIIKDFATNLKEALKEPEKVHILRILKEVGWNKKKAAKRLGLNRTTLYNKLRKYSLVLDKNGK
ncbi:MAG: hypothetical protein A2Z72_02280 [Omnitrophica bacterium RBG_13_46_9]|nr:MAG: hypothetical protein A2Z72_02280 [Omnitrophica bacterium RBG_13_46_9]